MHPYNSLLEVSLTNGHWHTIMVGIRPDNLKNAFTDFNPQKAAFEVYIAHRDITNGMYIRGLSLKEVASFLTFAKQSPHKISEIHKAHLGSGQASPAVTLDELLVDIILPQVSTPHLLPSDFPLVPSIEPFIYPVYVSQDEYMNVQKFQRMMPLRKLVKALQGEDINTMQLEAEWTRRNAPFARLAYVTKGSDYFDRVKYCEHGNHYWDWLEMQDGTLYVRVVYIAGEDKEHYQIKQKEEHPPEFNAIPAAVCPLHNPPLRLEGGFYVGTIPVSNKWGIHLRPSQYIIEHTNKYPGSISISLNGTTADAKVLFDVMGLAAKQGTSLTVKLEATGDPNPSSSFRRRTLRSTHRHIYRAANYELR